MPALNLPQCCRLLATLGIVLAAVTSLAHGQDRPPPAEREAIGALIGMLQSSGDEPLEAFIDKRLSKGLRASAPRDEHLDALRSIRAATEGALEDVIAEADQDGVRLKFSGAREAELRVSINPMGEFDRLELVTARDKAAQAAPPITWETLADRLRQEEQAGFSGVVLAVRNGVEALHRSYGAADHEAGRPTQLDTVYGIGSMPIDFTVTAVLLLAQRGELSLDDSIGKFFESVPEDKQAMTIRHLITGRSGLPDFHDIPADWDPDLAWIDRATAVQRILGQRLLFAPGEGDAHSHSAYGLAAAIIEIVSGESYEAFVRREILEPLGMNRTGFYGQTLGLDVDDFATGYGASSAGLPNIPPNWGPTSWLVMGSGGMCSTLGDLRRYYEGLEAGKILTGEWRNWQTGATVGAGGSDRGFFVLHASDGKGNRILLLTNGEGRSPQMRALTRALADLAEQPAAPAADGAGDGTGRR